MRYSKGAVPVGFACPALQRSCCLPLQLEKQEEREMKALLERRGFQQLKAETGKRGLKQHLHAFV